MDDSLVAEIRHGFLLLAAAILRSGGVSDGAMTNDAAKRLAEHLSDSLRGD